MRDCAELPVRERVGLLAEVLGSHEAEWLVELRVRDRAELLAGERAEGADLLARLLVRDLARLVVAGCGTGLMAAYFSAARLVRCFRVNDAYCPIDD